uniref:DNA ligase 1 n=1 Tax=Astyanax mexicanus TaxID=7994 RepID=A0A8B9JJ38_ASTMX
LERSFFQPMKCKEKKDEPAKVKSEPIKSPLKTQNGERDCDSPVKKTSKRARAIIDSDDEEQPTVKNEVSKQEEEQATKPDKEKADVKVSASPLSPKPLATPTTPATPATPALSAASGTPGTPATPNSTSPSGIPKRRTARKHFPKRKLDSRSDGEKEKEETEEDGKKKEEQQESKRARIEESADQTGESSLNISLSEKGAEPANQSQYDPSKAHYHPIDDACWKKGQKLRNIETLSNLLRSVILLSPDDLLCCVYLCLNQLGPAYQGLELGVGETVLMKAVAQATGRQLDKIKAEAQEKGDLGLVAESSRSNQRMMFAPASLNAAGVFNKLKEIGNMSGNSAMNKKIDIIKGLFVACRFSEARFIVRSLAGKLRIGLAEQSVLAALSQAVCLTPPGQEFPPSVIDAGKGMSTESRRAWLEEKVMKESVRCCVLDTEAVAWDREKKQIQPFQVLTTRKRKDVDASEIKVQVCVYAFDLLYLNGESLVREPLSRRRALLKESFVEKEGEFVFARSLDSDNTDTIAEFLEQSVRGERHTSWKLKKDYLEGVGDTMDLCVIGAYLGKGKRAGSYGGFLLACYDEENEEFQSVCKIGTGFKDEDLEQHYNFLKEHILPKPRPYYRVDQSAEPDVWLDAVQVWEVKCADLSLSPVYKAAMGLVDSEKGISLRFPRFLHIREDKKPEDATTGAQIADLYKKQQQIQNQGEKADLEDYY